MSKKTISGTREWASSSANCMTGCQNNCLYCYAKTQAITLGKATPETWKDEKPLPPITFKKRKDITMFPTQHDITDGNFEECLSTIKNILTAGNKILIVSKPRPHIISALCEGLRKTGNLLTWKPNILFRFTIGSMDIDTLKFWEPNAPTFAERLYSLMWAFQQGWQTSVSMEPMLDEDIDQVLNLVKTVIPYTTDAVWLGKANKLMERCQVNIGRNFTWEEDILISHLSHCWGDNEVKDLYKRVNKDKLLKSKVKWKESIKKVIGIELPKEAGLDI